MPITFFFKIDLFLSSRKLYSLSQVTFTQTSKRGSHFPNVTESGRRNLHLDLLKAEFLPCPRGFCLPTAKPVVSGLGEVGVRGSCVGSRRRQAGGRVWVWSLGYGLRQPRGGAWALTGKAGNRRWRESPQVSVGTILSPFGLSRVEWPQPERGTCSFFYAGVVIRRWEVWGGRIWKPGQITTPPSPNLLQPLPA